MPRPVAPVLGVRSSAAQSLIKTEWRSDEGAGRVGTLGVSSSEPYYIDEDFKAVMDLLARVIGFLFSLHGNRLWASLTKEGKDVLSEGGFSSVSDTRHGKRFKAALVGLRRRIAGHFEQGLLQEGKHELRNGRLHVLGSRSVQPAK